jgi:hypothetical protein
MNDQSVKLAEQAYDYVRAILKKLDEQEAQFNFVYPDLPVAGRV